MLSKPVVKKFASILEIIIMFCVMLYLNFKTITKYKVAEISSNWVKHRSNPMMLPFAGSAGKSSDGVLTGLVGQKAKTAFKPVQNILHSMFGVFIKIFKSFWKSIEKVRHLTKPIRTFFKNAAMQFYAKLQKFTIGVTYMIHKIRQALKRSISGFNMAFHTLNHIQYSFEAMYNSPMIPVTRTFLGIMEWVAGAFDIMGLCFAGNTLINSKRGHIIISKIEPGMELSNSNYVIAVHKFINEGSMFNYNNITISGSHLVNENDKWIRVSESKFAKPIQFLEDYIYCISTSKGIINIGDICFKDFSESHNKFVNKHINGLILKQINKTKNIINYNNDNIYLEQGLGKNSKLLTKTGYKLISDISVNDELLGGKVLGKIKLSSQFLDVYCYRNKYILSGNIKVYENGIWINVSDSIYAEKSTDYHDLLYHVIVENEDVYLDNLLIKDYLECHDADLNNNIDSLVSKFYNYE